MPFAEYQAIDAVNWSTLKHMGASPLHYRHACECGTGDTPAMLLGRAIHTAVLEPDEFPLRYAVYTGDRRAGKAWEEFRDANAGRDILKANEYDVCLQVRDAARRNAHVQDMLTGSSEVVKTWTDAETGIACKCRIDHVTADGVLVDVKSTATIDRHLFENTAGRLGYHGQAAFYQRGIERTGAPAYVIAVEQSAPFDVVVFIWAESALAVGDADVSEYLRRVKACRESGYWPGRYNGVQELNLPAWMEQDAETFGGLFGGE